MNMFVQLLRGVRNRNQIVSFIIVIILLYVFAGCEVAIFPFVFKYDP